MGSNVTDVGLEKKATAHELKKHAATIHCSNTLSLLQRKISNALLYHAYKELMTKEEHEISVKQLCNLISYNGNNHSVIKDALKGLISTVIEWNVVNDTTGNEDWSASAILSSVSLQGPTCLFAYSPRMKQLLHTPSMFGKINLFIQSRFKSSYGLALYENCIRYRGLPFTKWFDMETFRKIMGVPDDKYTIFRDFKRRVLDKSIEEVNTYSDMFVESEFMKEGRQVVKVRFCLKERAKKTRLGAKADSPETEEEDLSVQVKSQLVNDFGLSIDQIQQVMTEYEVEFIAEKIAVVESSKNFQQGKVLNLAGYFMSALKNNYLPGKTSVNKVAEKGILESRREVQHKEMKRLIEQIREEYTTYREQVIDREIAALSKEAKVLFLEKFQEQATDSINTVLQLQRNKYTRETVFNSPQIKALLRQFALQDFPLLQIKLISLEEFAKNLPEEKRNAWQEHQISEPSQLSLSECEI